MYFRVGNMRHTSLVVIYYLEKNVYFLCGEKIQIIYFMYFRVGNMRHTSLVEAHVRAILIR